MAALTFGIGDKILDYDVEDFKKIDEDLKSLYKNYQESNPNIFSTFRPVILSESKDTLFCVYSRCPGTSPGHTFFLFLFLFVIYIDILLFMRGDRSEGPET